MRVLDIRTQRRWRMKVLDIRTLENCLEEGVSVFCVTHGNNSVSISVSGVFCSAHSLF